MAALLGFGPDLTFVGDMMAGKIALVALTVAGFVAGLAVAEIAQTGREPQFDNEEVKVWKSVILPGSPLPMHRHDHPRVIIALTGGTMKVAEDTGAAETHDWQTGKAYWLPANPPGTHHQDINIGDKPIEVMVVELQKAK